MKKTSAFLLLSVVRDNPFKNGVFDLSSLLIFDLLSRFSRNKSNTGFFNLKYANNTDITVKTIEGIPTKANVKKGEIAG